MKFTGFPSGTVPYLKALAANNDRAWFEANRNDYETYYLTPAISLIEAMAPIAASLVPPHTAEPKLNGSLRRIHRDTRFSKDKTPYHTHIHIVFWIGGHPNRSAGIHFVLADDHFGYGAGHWAFDADGLRRYRDAVLITQTRNALEEACNTAAAIGCSLGEPELVRVPRGFEADDPAADWLRRKGIVARTRDGKGHDHRLFTVEATDYLTDILRALAPVNRWIRDQVVD